MTAGPYGRALAIPGRGGLVGAAEEAPVLGEPAAGKALGALRQLRLVERNAQRLGAHRVADGAAPLDVLLDLLLVAPGHQRAVLAVQARHELVPGGHRLHALRVLRARALQHLRLDLCQQRLHLLQQRRLLDENLLAGVAPNKHRLAVVNVTLADLQPDGDALQLPVVVLPAGGVVLARVALGAHARGRQARGHLVDLGVEALALLGGHLAVGDRDADDLAGRDARGQHEPLVVPVHHDHDADGARGEAPRVLPHQLLALVLRLVLDLKHLGKVRAQAVRGRALDAAPGGRHKGLHRRGVQAAGKLLRLGLDALDDRHAEQLLVHALVQVQDLPHLHLRLGLGGKGGVPLLPQKLAAADEGRGVLELPAHDVGPLVQLERQVAVAADPLRVVGVHHRLRGGADGQRHVQLRLPRPRHPRHLRGEALHVILLLCQRRLRHKQREVAVLHAHALDARVEPVLDGVPDGEGPGA
mmetsp:Transcript_36259/g.91114  ORF Transcript_36259/g.91114 Transcript_36259/m.91114 type:complete len:471 (+) Transcript_36259:51-1463(+)